MSTIDTLIPDIHSLVKIKGGWFDDNLARALSEDLAKRLQTQFGENTSKAALRLSQMGPRCPKALWTSIHHPEEAEPLQSWAEIKYAFGHVIEGLAVALSKAAGHEVVGEQDELVLDGIIGHRDCVIDGYTVDVKSSTSIGFTKFKSGIFDDTFGYLDQLDGYVLAASNDPLVKVKDKGFLLVVDKQLGHMCLYPHEVTNDRERTLRERIRVYKTIVDRTTPPACGCGIIPEGASGNMRLDLRASYSPYKYVCFPSLRTFLYANGPVFLTKVVKRPFNKDGPITEVDKDGKIVYH